MLMSCSIIACGNNSVAGNAEQGKLFSKTEKINKNETVEMKSEDFQIEFTLTDVVFKDDVYSRSDNSFARYYCDVEGESYIVAKINVKNVGGETIDYNIFDDMIVTFGDKYSYDMCQLDLESAVLSEYWSCQPLKTTEIYWLMSVPDEVKTMGCSISFKVGDVSYKY